MIRVVFFLVIAALLALGVGWFADRPGEVAVTWQGWRLETSVAVTLAAILAVVVALVYLWLFLRAILRSPGRIKELWHKRRGTQGYLAISRGLIAVGAGDARAALRHAGTARKLAPDEPLSLLLGAQSAQLSGDRAQAEKTFRTMAARADTRLLGLHGLYVEAQRQSDPVAARLYAEEAARSAPTLLWAHKAALQFRCAAQDWAGALEMVEAARRRGAIDRARYRRERAVLLTAAALANEESDRDRAREFAFEAARLAPDLVPAAVIAARFHSEAGEMRRARRIVEAAWRANPHPDLAEAAANLRPGDTARERLARVEKLAALTPDHPESAIAVARAAAEAREFPTARTALAPQIEAPERRVALLMARIEAGEGDEGRAREWTHRALNAAPDPAWTADNMVSDHWMPMSPVSGRLDAFEWRIPLAAIGATGAAREEAPDIVLDPAPAREDSAEVAPAASQTPAREAVRPHPKADAVVPVIHAPDDPGPEPEPESENAPEPAAPGWRRIFG